jgi:hypothetical protein
MNRQAARQPATIAASCPVIAPARRAAADPGIQVGPQRRWQKLVWGFSCQVVVLVFLQFFVRSGIGGGPLSLCSSSDPIY